MDESLEKVWTSRIGRIRGCQTDCPIPLLLQERENPRPRRGDHVLVEAERLDRDQPVVPARLRIVKSGR